MSVPCLARWPRCRAGSVARQSAWRRRRSPARGGGARPLAAAALARWPAVASPACRAAAGSRGSGPQRQ
eukprot:1548006-Heterocapsa_arctica.AAC.1